jgi:hypothetical protein
VAGEVQCPRRPRQRRRRNIRMLLAT